MSLSKNSCSEMTQTKTIVSLYLLQLMLLLKTRQVPSQPFALSGLGVLVKHCKGSL